MNAVVHPFRIHGRMAETLDNLERVCRDNDLALYNINRMRAHLEDLEKSLQEQQAERLLEQLTLSVSQSRK